MIFNEWILMNTAVLKKKIWKKNMIKHRDVKLATTERRRNYLVSKPNYHSTKFFYRRCFSNRNEKNWNTYEETCLFKTFSTRIK